MKCTLCGFVNQEGVPRCGACYGILASQPLAPPRLPESETSATAPVEAPVDPRLARWIPPPEHLERLGAELGDPDVFPAEVRTMYAAGHRLQAHAALRRIANLDPTRRAARWTHLRQRRTWAQPGPAPGMFTLNGIGTRPYGSDDLQPDGSFILTNFLVVLFIPVVALASHLVLKGDTRGWLFLAEVPVSETVRTWHKVVGGAAGALMLWLLGAVVVGLLRP